MSSNREAETEVSDASEPPVADEEVGSLDDLILQSVERSLLDAGGQPKEWAQSEGEDALILGGIVQQSKMCNCSDCACS